jgi:hypothetical protein
MLMQRARIGDTHPLSLVFAPRCARERLRARMRANLPQWNRESPWLAFNRRIAREEWTTPADSWIGQQR